MQIYLDFLMVHYLLIGFIKLLIMAQHIVIKKKNHVATLIATKVNKKRAQMIVDHALDKYATYLIAEVVETITPYNRERNEDRTCLQETFD